MNSERLQQVKVSPPNRSGVSLLTRVLGPILARLNLFFRRRHPGNFDAEFGSWQFPDVNITAGAGGNAPRPLINRDCESEILVYCFVSNPTPRCTFLGQLAALQQAIDQVSRYLRDEFRCENPCCLQEIGELVWFGLDCGQVPGPADDAAVLVRFRCIPEL